MKTVGVLNLQGAVAEHLRALNELDGVRAVAVKTMAEIEQVDGLILPGGESTAIGKLLSYFAMLEPLKDKINDGLPIWGTCAGMILLAKNIVGQDERYFDVMDITVRRNAYGGQLDSFATSMTVPDIAPLPLPLVFIRAPYIERAAPNVKTLAVLDGKIIAAAQDNMLVTSFHPELTDDISVHRYFCEQFIN